MAKTLIEVFEELERKQTMDLATKSDLAKLELRVKALEELLAKEVPSAKEPEKKPSKKK